MLSQYIQAALESARYEIIDDPEPYYAEVAAMKGVWASGRTMEECRRNLVEAIEDWLFFSLSQGHLIPTLGGVSLPPPQRIPAP